ALNGSIRPAPGGHRLRLGLPGYLILFAPPAFVPQCQQAARTLPAPSVYLRISTHFTAPPGIPRPPPLLKPRRLEGPRPVKPGDFTPHARCPVRTLYAQKLQTTHESYVLPRLRARSKPRLRPGKPSILPRPPEKRFTLRKASSRTRRCSV